jgi:rhamnose transport system ATP-binding protein
VKEGESPLLLAHSISKSFGTVHALRGVSISIGRGDLVALAGENGSGKSTLARILAGSLRADEGSVVLAGRERHFAGPDDALEAGIALVAQEPMTVPGMTVAENVLLHRLRRPSGIVRRRALNRDAAVYLEEVGLDVDPGRPFATLGHGERELAEVAKALSVEPQLLILDEATTRLPDPEQLFQVVERLTARRQLSAIIITHRLREIRRFAHRAIVLRDGALVGELAQDQLTDERISSMMVGRPLVDFFAKPHVAVGEPALRVVDLVTDRCSTPISFEAREGEIVGIAGLVGSGRSELLETIAGCRAAKGGSVAVVGATLGPRTPRAAMSSGVCLVPEDRWRQGLVRHDSVVGNHALSSHRPLAATDRRGDRRRARDDVRRYGIKVQSIDTPVGALSGGNAQKVVLARVLSQRPKVLLLDEPTRGVDIGAKAEIYAIVAEMVAAKVAVVVASSDLLELIGLCDRIVVLHDGEVAGTLARHEANEESIALLSAGGNRS